MTHTSTPFDKNVEQWIQYSESLKGRLRRDLTWHNLEPHIMGLRGKLRVIDVGCGLGDLIPFLLDRSRTLVLLDFSERMLETAKERLLGGNPGLKDKITFARARVEELDVRLPGLSFDVVLCHTILEYLEDPRGALSTLAGKLASGGILSILAANCYSETFKLAIIENDLQGARLSLGKKGGQASLFDDVAKITFSREDLEGLLGGLGLQIIGRYGVRVFTDYLREKEGQEPDERSLFDLEKEASRVKSLQPVARYIHLVCRKVGD